MSNPSGNINDFTNHNQQIPMPGLNIPRMLLNQNFFNLTQPQYHNYQSFGNLNQRMLLPFPTNPLIDPNLNFHTNYLPFVPYMNVLLTRNQLQSNNNLLNSNQNSNDTNIINNTPICSTVSSPIHNYNNVKLKSRLLQRHLEESDKSIDNDDNLIVKEVDSEAPFGRSKRGKPLKRPTFIPSYMRKTDSNQTLCVVCNQDASGLHYKAMTCEGCKGFFRRTIQQKLKYECKRNNQCCVNRKEDGDSSSTSRSHRDVCRACRWRKCRESGMDPGSVLNEAERQAKNELIRINKQKRIMQLKRHQLYRQRFNISQLNKPIKMNNKMDSQSESSNSNETKMNNNLEFENNCLKQLQNLQVYLPKADDFIHLQDEKRRREHFQLKLDQLVNNLPGFEMLSEEVRCEVLCSNKSRQASLALSLFTYSPQYQSIWLPNGKRIHLPADNVNKTHKTLLSVANITHQLLGINQLEQIILFGVILFIDGLSHLCQNSELSNLENIYLKLFNRVTMTSDKIRGSKILTIILPELNQLSCCYISGKRLPLASNNDNPNIKNSNNDNENNHNNHSLNTLTFKLEAI